ncbi:MAG TPA: cyanophycinase [Longimicrobiales bacterium]|nr:cyanophycinase [Longimicrobiales bacterium]
MRPLLRTCWAPALCLALLASCAGATQHTPAVPATIGPESGTLFIAGGGTLGSGIISRFVQLAGGPDARLVIIPTAGTRDSFPDDWPGVRMFRDAGVRHITVLHTRSRDTADMESFTEPLRNATAVWLPGGRQWRLADAYLDTRTLREIRGVLQRGGAVGGTSAGASIQASYMVRGAVESNEVVMATGHEAGFGLLRNTAVDQHLTERGRQDDLLDVIRRYPELLGIGIDESTALVVKGNRAEVTGQGRVAFYNTADRGELDYYFLSDGDAFDLARRTALSGRRISPQTVRDEAEVIAAMNRLFDAMRMRDTAAIRALAHPDLHTFIPAGTDGAPDIRSTPLDAFIAQVGAAADRLDEKAIDPEVRVDGRLASVWTSYDFLRGSNFSHCGTDAFHFVKGPDGWVITGLAYTIQRENCSR